MKMNKKLIREIMMFTLITFIFCMCIYVAPIYAATIKDSKLVTGTKSLITDVLNAIKVIAPLVAGLVCAVSGFQLSSAEDDQEAKVIKKRMKTAVIGGMVALVGSVLADIALKYFV